MADLANNFGWPIKPEVPVLDLDHPLANRLMFDVQHIQRGGAREIETVSGAPVNLTGSGASVARSSNGIVKAFTGSTAVETLTARGYHSDPRHLSIEVVAYVNALSGGGGGFPRLIDGPVNFLINESSGLFNFQQLGWSGGASNIDSGISVPVASWFHLVVTYDNTTLSTLPIYYLNSLPDQNGSNITPPSGTPPSDTGGTAYTVGNRAAGDRGLNGQISYVRVWNRTLSQREVVSLYENPYQIYRKQASPAIYLAAFGLTGDANITETNDTTSSAGGLVIAGASAITEANDTTSSSATAVQLTGAAAIQEANDTTSSAGALVISGTLAATEANDTTSGAGALVIAGTATPTEANDTTSSAGALVIAGTLAKTEANDTTSSTGALVIAGALAATEANDTISAQGGAAAVTADAAITEANDTTSGAGALVIAGALAKTEANDTLNSQAGSPAAVADAAIQEANDTVVSAGALSIAAAAAIVEANDTTSATGGLLLTGALAKTEANDTMVSNAGAPAAVANANIVEANDTVVSSGSLPLTGSVAFTEANDNVSSNAGTSLFGILQKTEADDVLVSAARLTEGLLFDKSRVVFYQRKTAIIAEARTNKLFAG